MMSKCLGNYVLIYTALVYRHVTVGMIFFYIIKVASYAVVF
jgi:hypothetical protein